MLKLHYLKTHSAETSFLVGLERTEVTTEVKPDLQLPTRTWIITEKLEEISLLMSQFDIDSGLEPGRTVGKFRCYLNEDISTEQLAFIRVLLMALSVRPLKSELLRQSQR